MTTSLLIINCLGCNCGLIDYWLFEHKTRDWWGYCSCIYPSFVYVSLKEIGVMGLDTYTSYTWGIKYFHKCWSGSLAKRRLCLGSAGVINCTPLKKKKETFGVDQIHQWIFWTEPNILQTQSVVLMMLQKPKPRGTDFKILSRKRHDLTMQSWVVFLV